jgi:hypothetical protein
MSFPPTTTKGSGDANPVVTFEIDAPNIPITHTGTKASFGTIPVAGGGTGATTLTAHGVLVGNAAGAIAVTSAGTAGQVLTSNGPAADPTFQAAGGGTTGTYASKAVDYTLTTSDDVIGFDASGAAKTATLPTAAGNSGKQLKIVKTDTTANTVTINTTSAQTIGGRTSGAIVFRRPQDSITVVSDGTNWQILEKKEFEYINSSALATISGFGTAGNYGNMGFNVTLSPGLWKLTATAGLNFGSSTGLGILQQTGFYSADGANNATVPTALTGIVSGDPTFASVSGSNGYLIYNPSSPGTNARQLGGANSVVVQVATSTTVYLVPRLDFSVAGTSTVFASITAERLF